MDSLIILQSQKLAKERDAFLQEFKLKRKIIKAPSSHDQYIKKHESETGYTFDQLREFATTLQDDYLNVDNATKEQDDIPGVAWGLSNYIFRFGDPENTKPMRRERKRRTKESALNEKAEVNYQKTFLMCVELLERHSIIVDSVTFYPSKFRNRNRSSCVGGTRTFAFECHKNHYKFSLSFDDDCDCDPGILGLSNILNTINNETIPGYCCDLFCQNTKKTRTNIFLSLLECKDFREFHQKHFSIYEELAKMLNGKLVNKSKQECPVFCPNDHELDFFIEVPRFRSDVRSMENLTEKGPILLIPLSQKNKFVIHLSTSTFTERRSSRSGNAQPIVKPVKSLFDFEHVVSKIHPSLEYEDVETYPFKMEYKTHDDLPRLQKMIAKYLDFCNGEFGFEENGVFYNFHQIDEAFKKYKTSQRYKAAIIQHNEDLMSGRVIDSVVTLTSECHYDSMLPRHFEMDAKYPLDQYTIRFLYVSEEKEMSATITGRYQFVDEISSYYHTVASKKSTETRDEQSDLMKGYENKIVEFESIVFNGSFTQVITQCVNLFDQIFSGSIHQQKNEETVEFDDFDD